MSPSRSCNELCAKVLNIYGNLLEVQWHCHSLTGPVVAELSTTYWGKAQFCHFVRVAPSLFFPTYLISQFAGLHSTYSTLHYFIFLDCFILACIFFTCRDLCSHEVQIQVSRLRNAAFSSCQKMLLVS